jgi:CheY-like chemotaxis protein
MRAQVPTRDGEREPGGFLAVSDSPPLPPGLDAYRPPQLLGSAVLVVDDEPSLRDQLRRDLVALGYEAVEADAAAAARELLAARPVAAVILDLMLGDSDDGFQLLAWIRQEQPLLPVTVLSAARTASAHIRRAYELGASSYFVKGNTPLAHLYSDLAARMLDARAYAR